MHITTGSNRSLRSLGRAKARPLTKRYIFGGIIEISTEVLSVIALLISGLSALYARWAVGESKKANELNRFKALLDLKSGYLNEMSQQMQAAKDWGKDDGFSQACRNKYAEADSKHREVCRELDAYHSRLVKNKI